MAQIPWYETNASLSEVCIKQGVDVVTFPYYRVMQCVHIVLSVLSTSMLLFVLTKYRSKLIFHYNIRVLFMSIFAACLLHASLMAFFQTYQMVLSFTYTSPCDVILPRFFYVYLHVPFTFSVLWIEGTQIVMLLERMIAIFYVGQYETCTKKLGHALLFLSFIVPVLECTWEYAGEDFMAAQISCLNTPATRAVQVNMLFIANILLHGVAFTSIVIVYVYHRRKVR
ncbi:hypothetical protein Q1695_007082 [Nippostrongylus brasiliensis]|nr:hypothetical protein Q1695_007082 [Nippostrongylus brasiliensis]